MVRLRSRLFFAFGIVIFVAVGTISIFVTRFAGNEFDNYEEISERLQTTRMAQWLTGFYLVDESWEGVQPFAEEMDAITGVAVVVADGTGAIVGNSRSHEVPPFPPSLWSKHELFAGSEEAGIGTLYLSSARTIQEQYRARLQSILWILLLGGSALGAVAALIVSTVVAAMISAPISSIARAAVKAGGGDFSQRVDIRRNDEVGELAGAFNRMVEDLDAGLRQRRNQIADTAHELRNPVTNIRGYVEALNDGVMGISESLPVLRDEIELLTRLIDDLQELALAESGILKIERRTEDLLRIVGHAISAMRPRAKEKNIAVTLEAPDDTIPVYADGDRIGQVFSNILRNALYYTPPGGTVTVSIQSVDESVTVSVCDTGSGIPPQELERIFERFRRLDPARSRSTGGSGLGLTIARLLVELHGGKIVAENRQGGGSCFSFTIPRDVTQ